MVNLNAMLPLDGCSVAFRDSGPGGRAVLFLHGAGADHVSFEEQASAVANSGRRAVVWDMRAHGLSRPNRSRITADRFVADAEALISELGLDHPVLVGHSLGGNIAQEMVRREPEAYSGLVVIDATWNSGPLGWMERRLLHLAAPTLSLIPARTLPGLMARASAVTDAAQQDLMRAFSQVPKRDSLAIWQATASFVRPAPHYRTPIPLCLIRGAQDRTGNIAKAMPAWAEHEGNGEVVIPDAGHVPSQDAPEAVTTALLRFLDTLDEAR
jgi:3-oxoadipate enol-lactonase